MFRVRSSAPDFVKRIVWNRKHMSTSIDPAGCPEDLLENLRSLDPGSSLLDLGCGTGNLRAALRLRGWSGHFIGVDVSTAAIETAKTAKDPDAEWHVSTIDSFLPIAAKVDVVCICESLYYVDLSAVPDLLERCRQALVYPKGRTVVRIAHLDRHREYVELLLRSGGYASAPLYILKP